MVATRVLATGVLAAAALSLLGAPGSATEPVAVANPVTTRAEATSATPSVATSEVTAVVQRPNGITEISHYQPAPGVTAKQLHTRLKALKVPGLQRPGADRATTLAPCVMGTATTVACPPVHWTRNGHAKPQIYFADYSSAVWPVSQLVPVWHRARGIDSRYSRGPCPSTAGIHCVQVNSGDFGAMGWLGRTISNFRNDDNTFIDARVQLNDYYRTVPAERRHATCHELGHVLGLGHSSSPSSCMSSPASTVPGPHADDYNLLASIYSSI